MHIKIRVSALTEMSTKVNEKLKNFIYFSVTLQYTATHSLKHIVFLN